MVELIGDPCIPSALVAPTQDTPTSHPTMSGSLFVSGAKLCLSIGGATEIITST